MTSPVSQGLKPLNKVRSLNKYIRNSVMHRTILRIEKKQEICRRNPGLPNATLESLSQHPRLSTPGHQSPPRTHNP